MKRTSPGVIVLVATIAFRACIAAAAEPRVPPAGSKTPVNEAAVPQPVRQRGYVEPLTQNERLLLERERMLEEVFDDETLYTKLAELEAWIRRIPDRFRIEGRVERMGAGGPVGGKVSGVADCASVGEGVGVQCIFNATWPIIDPDNTPVMAAIDKPIARPTPSDALRSFNPALLVFGLDPALAEVRAVLVTDDSLAHMWAGRLKANTLRATRLTGCRESVPGEPRDFRCFQPLELTAEPGSEIVTIVLRSAGITITLAMRRDPEARAEKRMKVQ